MKKLLFFLGLLCVTSKLHAFPITPVIISTNVLQSGTTVYVSSFTATNANFSNLSISTITMTSPGKLTGLGNGVNSTDAMAFGQNHVFQFVSSSTITQFTTTSASFQSTFLGATITPSTTTSKVAIFATGTLVEGTNGAAATLSVKRGSTDLSVSNGGFVTLTIQAGQTFHVPASLVYLDSPNTTSATTYTITVKSDGTNSVSFGNGADLESLILVEVQ